METRNRHHAHAPSKLTPADLERQRIARRQHDQRKAREAARERTARLVYWGLALIVGLAMVYSLPY